MERSSEFYPNVEVYEISESRRIFSTTQLSTNEALVADIVTGIRSNPYVDEVGVNNSGPNIDFVVDVTHPEHWDKYVDPHCRETIEMAIEAQRF
jgi:hypothetical protein